MKKRQAKAIASCALYALLLAGAGEDQLFALTIGDQARLAVTQDFLYNDNRVTGSNTQNSFLTPGRHFTENLGALLDATAKGVNWQGALDGRATDDTRIEQKRYNLKRFFFKGETEKHSATLGDYLASFSQYTLGKSLKGAQYTYRIDRGAELTVLFGLDKANWDDLWIHKDNETVDRKFYGARAAKRFQNDAFLGASAVWSDDARSRFNTTAVLSNQKIFGLDWALPALHRLRLSGESAFSKTDNDNPATAASSQRGWAHNVHADYAHRRFKTQNSFERVSPEYATTGGAAATDLLQVNTRNTLTIVGPWKLILLNYNYFRNNLNHASGGSTTQSRSPETGLRYDGPDWRPTFSADLKARDREVLNSANAKRNRTRSFVADINDRFGPVSVNLDYEYQFEDASDATSDLRHHILSLSGNYFKRFESGWTVSQALRWNLQRDRNTLIGLTDQAGVLSANIATVSPWGVDANASYTRNLVANAQNPSSDRRVFSAGLGYNLLKNPNHRLEARFHQNDNRSSTAAQDFKEMAWEAQLTNRF